MIQLLSVGRSLQGSGDRSGLYNIDAGAIPRFEGSAQMSLRLPKPAEAARPPGPAVRSVETRGAKAAARRLTLDDVKVVRNDLNETDITVVVHERPAATGRDATFERREVAGWKRLTERLFHPGGAPVNVSPFESRPRQTAARA